MAALLPLSSTTASAYAPKTYSRPTREYLNTEGDVRVVAPYEGTLAFLAASNTTGEARSFKLPSPKDSIQEGMLTPFGRKLLQLRRAAIAAGMKTLSTAEIMEEIRAARNE